MKVGSKDSLVFTAQHWIKLDLEIHCVFFIGDLDTCGDQKVVHYIDVNNQKKKKMNCSPRISFVIEQKNPVCFTFVMFNVWSLASIIQD